MEEESRKHPPNDGLVALLMPTPATKIALEKADDPQAVMMAERECARLVWDEDSASHFLVHPALATPFCVTIERSHAWSRVEYTLEHHESPQHLAKLTRDGTGGGWLEIDTGIASKIESFYVIDVAVSALMLVAASDEKNLPVMAETFEPPPPPPAAVLTRVKSDGRLSRFVGKKDDGGKRENSGMEVFEIDVESQESYGKGKKSRGKKEKKGSNDDDDDFPLIVRAIGKVLKGVFKLLIWVLTIGFKCLGLVFKGCWKCLGSKY